MFLLGIFSSYPMRSPEARTVQRWGNHPDALHKAVVVANRCENTGELVVIVQQDGSPMIFILWDTKSGSSLRNNKWAKPDKRYFICEHKAPSCWLNFLRTKCFSHAFFHIVFYLYIRYTSVTAEIFLHATISYPSHARCCEKTTGTFGLGGAYFGTGCILRRDQACDCLDGKHQFLVVGLHITSCDLV